MADGGELFIISNAFKVDYEKINIYRYNIKIDTRVTREMRNKIFRRFISMNLNYISDSYFENDSLYSTKKIDTNAIRKGFSYNQQIYELIIEFNQLNNYFYDTEITWPRFIEMQIKKYFTLKVDNTYITEQHPISDENNEEKYNIVIGFKFKVKSEDKNNTKIMILRKVFVVDDKYFQIDRHTLPECIKNKLNELINISKAKLFQYIMLNAQKIKVAIEPYGLILNLESPVKSSSEVLAPVDFMPENLDNKTFYKCPPNSITWALFVLDEYEKLQEFVLMFEERAKLFSLQLKNCEDRRFLDVQCCEQILYIFQNLKLHDVSYVIFGINSGSFVFFYFH